MNADGACLVVCRAGAAELHKRANRGGTNSMPSRRFLLQAGGALVAGASMNVCTTGWASASCPDIDPMTLVDPELRASAAEIQKNSAHFPPPQ